MKSVVSVFFHYFGTGALLIGKNGDKTGNLGNFIQVVIKLKHNASFLGVLEITDNPGRSFLSYNNHDNPFSFLFSFFFFFNNFDNDWEIFRSEIGKY
jgi:hypothetical protein